MRASGVLLVFGGLPGTGKTTVARLLAMRLRAVYLRIDSAEQAIRGSGVLAVGVAGYAVAQAVAFDNLVLGATVVADCVNPVKASRAGWRAVAQRAGVVIADIHLICSDVVEHERRVDARVSDIQGHRVPDWADVGRVRMEARDEEHLVLDTAWAEPSALVERCLAYIAVRAEGADA